MIDFVHTLAFKGMNLIPSATSGTAVQLWILARFIQAMAFLLAPLFLTRSVRVHWIVGIWGLISIAGIADIMLGGWFPVCFIEGVGLTSFKKISEIVIILILAGSAIHLSLLRNKIDQSFYINFMVAIFLSILSEGAFTGYVAFTDAINWVGHTFKFFAFFLLYAAIVSNGLRRPVEVLARDVFLKVTDLDEATE